MQSARWIATFGARNALWLLLCAGAAAADDGGPGAEAEAEATARLERLLADADTFRAAFTQRLLGADGALAEEAAGHVEVARPGRFRWEYVTPYEQLIVTDGDRVWMYDADLEQVSVSRVEQALADSPAMLLGGGRLSAGFSVTGAWQREGLDWVSLQPLVRDTDFRRVVLAHDGETVRRMELVDALGQETHIEFHDVRRDVDLPDGRFRFEAPDGVDVIGMDGR